MKKKETAIYDAHYHLFDADGVTQEKLAIPENIRTVVGFADINLKRLNKYKDVIPYYDKYMRTDFYDGNRIKLCATALTPENLQGLVDKYPDKFVGFGEFKCYDQTDEGVKLPYGNLDWLEPMMEVNTKKLPVYIHYEINSDKKFADMDAFLDAHKDTPIVLCHLGVVRRDNYKLFNKYTKKLIEKHENLYTDVSWEITRDVATFNLDLSKIPSDRILPGSDISNLLMQKKYGLTYATRMYKDMVQVHNMYEVGGNLKKLFGL